MRRPTRAVASDEDLGRKTFIRQSLREEVDETLMKKRFSMDLDIYFAFGKCDKTFVFCGLDYRFLRLDLFLKKIRGRFFLSKVCVWK